MKNRRSIPIILVLALVLSLGLFTSCSSGAVQNSTTVTTANSTETAAAATPTAAPTFKRQILSFNYFSDNTSVSAQGILKFKELVEKRTGGQVTIDCYWNGTLYSQGSQIEALMKGSVDFISAGLDYSMKYVPELKAAFCPYLWKNMDMLNAFMATDEGKDLLAQCQEVGIRYLSFGDNGDREVCLNTDKKIASRADLNGVKLRAATSEMMISMVEAMGANPISIPFADAYLSIQTGVVDGLEVDLPGLINSGISETIKSVSMTRHQRGMDAIVVSEKNWESWSPELQQVIQESATEASAYVNDIEKNLEGEKVKALKDAGIVVYELTDAERASYSDEVVEYYLKMPYAKDINIDILNSIRELGKNY